MAKKRVHELAKQYDIPLAEVMKRLNAYGLNVKAAASAVDEGDADRALTGKAPPAKSDNGAQKAKQPRPPATTGMGFDRPASRAAQEAREKRIAEERARREAQARSNRPSGDGQARNGGGGGQPAGDGAGGGAAGTGGGGGGGERRQRPTRSSLQGERTPGTAGGVRRV